MASVALVAGWWEEEKWFVAVGCQLVCLVWACQSAGTSTLTGYSQRRFTSLRYCVLCNLSYGQVEGCGLKFLVELIAKCTYCDVPGSCSST